MPQITIVDTDHFTITPAPSGTTYSISGTQAQIGTLEAQIAQIILNALQAIDVSAQLAEIANLQALLSQAQGAGATIPSTTILDTTDLRTALAALIALATTEAAGTQA